MLSVERVSNVLGDTKEEVVTTPSYEKKYSTKDVEKGTDKLADMLLIENKYSTNDVEKGTYKLEYTKQEVNTIHRKGLYQCEVQSSGSKGWFKLDSGILKITFSKIHSEFHK